MAESEQSVEGFHHFRKRIYAHPTGGEKLIQVYDDWANNFKEVINITCYPRLMYTFMLIGLGCRLYLI